jgi:hypothetical protein
MMGGRDWRKTAMAWGFVNGSTQGRQPVVRVEGAGPQKAMQKHWSGLHFLSSLFRQHTLSAQLGNGSV